VVNRIWKHLEKHDLRAANERRRIKPYARLAKIFGEKRVRMFEMNKHTGRHLTAKKD